jgi:hypothetical protein
MCSVREKALMASKWIASFFRRDWKLADYPVRVRANGKDAAPDQQWLAQVLNWPGPVGVGATKEEALAALGKDIEGIRNYRRTNQEKMPRPGTKVPIQFAPTTRVSADIELHDDFIIRVLGFVPGSPVFISDESVLRDFGDENNIAEYQKRIREIYGIDVSDLKSGLLCEIFERIQKRG